MLAITTFVLDNKRKVWIKNDEWLEENRNKIMESVMVYDRFANQYDKAHNEDDDRARGYSGIFDEELQDEEDRKISMELLDNKKNNRLTSAFNEHDD